MADLSGRPSTGAPQPRTPAPVRVRSAAARTPWYRRLDHGVFLRAAVALSGIGLGLMLEGGTLLQVLQPSAALIVFSGTVAAVAVQFPMDAVRSALRAAAELVWRAAPPAAVQGAELLRLAAKARQSGIVSLDAELDQLEDPFTRRCLMLAIDGITPAEIEEVAALDCDRLSEEEEQAARVWEAAGGFAPTMGILGAVLGLIQVMQRLNDLHGVGRGIAVAFVATVYGVGSANLVFLPVAGRLRLRMERRRQAREVVLDAILQIARGAGPRALRERLSAQLGSALPAGVARVVSR